MYQIEVVRSKFTDDEIYFVLKKLDDLIKNWNNLGNKSRLSSLLNIRDELERWC